MDDIAHALAAAWRRIRPTLQRTPAELRRRLARRAQALLRSPPRAWCLAIRASDTRLGSLSLSSILNPPSSHRILVASEDLRRLCSPVRLDWPGESLADVARKLGVT